MEFVWFVVVGIAAGWIAGVVMKGRGLGLWGNLVVGVIGALVGGFLFRLMGVTAGGLVGQIVIAAAGAIILLALVRLVRRM
ncbi:MAG: GlsB/YeaQ/YmgE family stress response membrane protein [Burkholderiales bacterium]|nr:GlsB/YeaQ/YmgE family stress response membrane protein [Burkholderiales bacterium]MCE7877359.1 GlsB/YeaQ/YmgE family stress response membrane protein [Betaproteobacteria bacterium PRO3]